MKKVCVFAASSSRIDGEYEKEAYELGRLFAGEGIEIVYGGGGIGLMGVIANSVMENGGKVTGVIPGFMVSEGWGHPNVKDMIVTADMGERKKMMMEKAEAVVALPGGIGTLEELTEAITLKQLGIFRGPVIILNTLDYYRSLLEFLEHMVKGSFLRFEHRGMWEVVNSPAEVINALNNYQGWHEDPRQIARIV